MGRLLGNILESFSCLFGDLVSGGVLGTFWGDSGVDFRTILGGFWDDFLIIFAYVLHVFFVCFWLSTRAPSFGNLSLFPGLGAGSLGKCRADAGQGSGRCWGQAIHKGTETDIV